MEKPETNYPPTAAETCYVVALRDALLQAGQSPLDSPRHAALMRKVDLAAEPLLDRCSEPLLRYCDSLARRSGSLKDHSDGEDIAQDAWTKSIRYLKSDAGARLKDDAHFVRFLYATAKSRFLDIHRSTVASTDATPALLNEHTSPSPADVFSPLGNHRTIDLIELLFTDEDAFRRSCSTTVRRKLIHYQAFVLYQLGQFLHLEAIERAEDGRVRSSQIVIRLMRQYTETLGIPAGQWLAVEQAVVRSAGESDGQPCIDRELVVVINQLCGSAIKPGNNLSVLRHELNGFVGG